MSKGTKKPATTKTTVPPVKKADNKGLYFGQGFVI